jgi:predicted nucleic acid-binding protein
LALEEIASLKEKGKVLIVSSDYVKMELEEIEDEEKREDVVNFERSLSGENVEDSDELKHLSSMIVRTCNVGVLDALHLCSAVVGNAEFFLTCDEDIINKRSCIIKVLRNKGHVINMLNPVQYLESVWGIRVERSQK